MHKQLGNESPANVSKNRLAWLISAKITVAYYTSPYRKKDERGNYIGYSSKCWSLSENSMYVKHVQAFIYSGPLKKNALKKANINGLLQLVPSCRVSSHGVVDQLRGCTWGIGGAWYPTSIGRFCGFHLQEMGMKLSH